MIKRYISNRQIAEDTDDTQDPIDPTDNTNTLGDVFQAIKRAILTVKEEENNDDSPPLFKTVAIDTGQFERVMSKVNTEYETAFPACFVRFTNVHFLVAQQRIGEGRGIIRIRFILNKLDNQHVNWETYPFYIAERLNKAIQDAKKVEEALQERCNLMYFDTPQSTNMLQAYWLDYEIYFKINTWREDKFERSVANGTETVFVTLRFCVVRKQLKATLKPNAAGVQLPPHYYRNG